MNFYLLTGMNVRFLHGRLIHLFVSVAALGVYVAACLLPAFWGQGGFFEAGETLYGVDLLLFGWLTLFTLDPTWLANLGLLLALVCMWRRRYQWALGVSIAALGLACLSIRHIGRGLEPRVGFYLWIGSMVVLALGVIAVGVVDRRGDFARLLSETASIEGRRPLGRVMGYAFLRPVCLVLSGWAILLGGVGMVISFVFLMSPNTADETAGTAGFVAGAVLAAAGLISLSVLAVRATHPGPAEQSGVQELV